MSVDTDRVVKYSEDRSIAISDCDHNNEVLALKESNSDFYRNAMFTQLIVEFSLPLTTVLEVKGSNPPQLFSLNNFCFYFVVSSDNEFNYMNMILANGDNQNNGMRKFCAQSKEL
ncbi:hypothetical protein L596_017385 [Steinernema carpocapsae]|uniref:Uncharacterized protein n=1 Tax=Steinernema carpocapsae TaxID=34508 RepID=A0A4U5N1Q5_STECR|nr:hypothetical protein L596_017385 [Steinernema carpocapsae]